MKKLTQAVFDLPECPEWAESAAVDSDGDAFWYNAYPHQLEQNGEYHYINEDDEHLPYHHPDGVSTMYDKYIGSDFNTNSWAYSVINRE